MSGKRKFSKTGIVLVFCMLICLILALAVVPGGFGSGEKDKSKDLDDENTPGLQTVIEDGSPLLIFDKRTETKALMSAFEDDAIESVSAALGNEGGAFALDTADQNEITAVYKALKNVVVGEELGPDDSDATSAGNASNTDGGCNVFFTLSDGSTCDFTFESSEVYYINGDRYAVSGTEDLWSVIEELGK